MKITDLKYPVLMIAPDGWVELVLASDDMQSWGPRAINKYSKIGFTLICSDNQVWSMLKIEALEQLSLFSRFFGALSVPPPTVKTDIELQCVTESPLEVVRKAFLAALEEDDDIITQWSSEDTIHKAIKSIEEISEFVPTLSKLKVI